MLNRICVSFPLLWLWVWGLTVWGALAVAAQDNSSVVVQNGHAAVPAHIQFSRDGRRLFTWSTGGFMSETVGVAWDVSSGLLEQRWNFGSDMFGGAKFAPSHSGQFIARVEGAGVVVRRAVSGEAVWQLVVKERDTPIGPVFDDGIKNLIFSEDDRFLIGARGHDVLLWTLPSQPRVTTPVLAHIMGGHEGDVAVLTTHGQWLASADSGFSDHLGAIRVRKLGEDTERCVIPVTPLGGGKTAVRSLEFSPDGESLAGAGDDNLVRVWKCSDGSPLQSLPGNTAGQIERLEWNHDGRFLLSSGGGFPLQFHAWNAATGKELELPANVGSVTWTPDGNALAMTVAGRGVRVREVEGGKVRVALPVAGGLSFGPDDDTLVVTTPGGIELWSLKAKAAFQRFRSPVVGIRKARFYGQGDSVAVEAAGDFAQPLLWNLKTGELIRTNAGLPTDDNALMAYRVWENSNLVIRVRDNRTQDDIATLTPEEFGYAGFPVSWSRDHKRLLSEGTNEARVWSVPEGNGVVVKLLDSMAKTCLSADGKWVVSSATGKLRVYNADTGRVSHQWEITGDARINQAGDVAAFWRKENKGFVVVNLATGAQKWIAQNVPDENSLQCAWSDDGQLLAVSSNTEGEVALLAGNDGHIVRRLKLPPLADLGPYEKALGTPLGFDTHATRLAVRDNHNYTQIFAVGTGQLLASVEGYEAAFSPDGARLLTWNADGLRLWDATSGKLVVTMAILNDDNWAMVTPDNYYMTSPQGGQGLAFQLGERVFAFDQFELQSNRPDIVLARLGFAAPAQLARQANKFRARWTRVGLAPPTITVGQTKTQNLLVAPMQLVSNIGQWPRVTSEAQLSLRVAPRATPFARVEVSVNGVPVQKKNFAPNSITVPLLPGENRIEVRAVTAQGTRSEKQQHTVWCQQEALIPDLYVVAVGVSRYAQNTYNLKFAAKDATDIADFFKEQHEPYGEVKTLILTDEEATRQALPRIKAFLAEARLQDHVIVTFSGHGLLGTDSAYYFALHDIDFAHPEERGLSFPMMEDLVDDIAPRWKLMLMDSCHAGELERVEEASAPVSDKEAQVFTALQPLAKGVVRENTGLPETARSDGTVSESARNGFADLRQGTGAFVMAAAGGAEYAIEKDGNGVFTFSVLLGLTDALADSSPAPIGNHDGVVQVSELQRFSALAVPYLTNNRQLPVLRDQNREFAPAFPPPRGLKWNLPPIQSVVGPAGAVKSLTLSADGRTLGVRAGIATQIYKDGNLDLTMDTTLALSPSGELTLLEKWDTSPELVKTQTGESLFSLKHTHKPTFAVFSPDEKWVATSVLDEEPTQVHLWDARTGTERILTSPDTKSAVQLQWSPGSNFLSCQVFGGKWVVFDVQTGAVKGRYDNQVTFLPDDRLMAVWESGGISLLDTHSLEKTRHIDEVVWGRISVSPDGQWLVSAGNDAVLRFWSIADGKLKAQWDVNRGGAVVLVWQSDGKTLWCGNADGTVNAWDVATILKQ